MAQQQGNGRIPSVKSVMSDWGSELGSLAAGIGSGAANYELAKHYPQGYAAVQKWAIILFTVFLLFMVVFFLVSVISPKNKDKNK